MVGSIRSISSARHALLFLALTAAGLTGAQAQTTDAGQFEYLHNCAACHGKSGKGDGPVSQYLIKKAPDLTRLAVENNGSFPRIEVHELIDGRRILGAHGNQAMPIWGNRFSAEGLWAVDPAAGRDSESVVRARIVTIVDYLDSIQASR